MAVRRVAAMVDDCQWTAFLTSIEFCLGRRRIVGLTLYVLWSDGLALAGVLWDLGECIALCCGVQSSVNWVVRQDWF